MCDHHHACVVTHVFPCGQKWSESKPDRDRSLQARFVVMLPHHALLQLNASVRGKSNLKTCPKIKDPDPWTVPKHALPRLRGGAEGLPRIRAVVKHHFLSGNQDMTVELTPEQMPSALRWEIKHHIQELRGHWREYEKTAQKLYTDMVTLPRTQQNKGSNFNHTFQDVRPVSKVPASLHGGQLPNGFTDRQLTGHLMDLIFSTKGTSFLPAVNPVVYGNKKADDINPYHVVTRNDKVSIETSIGEPEDDEEITQQVTIQHYLITTGLHRNYKNVMLHAHLYNTYSLNLLANFQNLPVKIEINGAVVEKDALTNDMNRAIVLCIADAVGYDLEKILDKYAIFFVGDTLPSDDEGSDEGGDEGGDEDERAVPPLRRPRRKRGESDDEKEDQNDADYDAAAKALCFTFHERLKRHLRYHSAIQLMILFYNEKKVTKTLDKTVPTLSGFAAYLNTFFGFLIKQSIITNDSRNKTISLFYESEWAPAWNMLPDEQGTKNLQEYLDSYHFTSIPNGKLSKLMPAPAHLFPGEWPLLPEVGSLDTYIFAGQEVSMPPIRMVTMEFECVELVAEIILPIRLLLDSSCYDLESNRTIWIPQYNAYTMQVTWDMLAQCSWKDEMPPDFEIIDHRGAALNAERSLPDGSPLTPHLLAVWADVLLTYSAHHGENCFRKRVDDLPLFRYSVLVVNRIKDILPSFLHCNIYIDGDENAGDFRYRNSPIQRDWGETRWEEDEPDVWELKLDPEFQELDQCQPPSRKSWATSGFFDMSLFFMKRIIGLRNTPIWNERLYDEDISWLMKQAALWSRHTFAAAKMVVKKQHNLLTTSNPGATGIQVNLPVVTQARPRGQLTSINRKRRW